jgi:dCMP deaminase
MRLLRPEWDDFWFTLALMYSTRGTCDRLRAATIIVKNKRIVGAGYNGSVGGQKHCDEIGHLIVEGHCERTLHGEENAVINTEREDLKDATAYLIGTPCYRCARILINSGVKEIKYLGEYKNSRGKELIRLLAKSAKVKLISVDKDPLKLIKQATVRLEGAGGAIRIWTENHSRLRGSSGTKPR